MPYKSVDDKSAWRRRRSSAGTCLDCARPAISRRYCKHCSDKRALRTHLVYIKAHPRRCESCGAGRRRGVRWCARCMKKTGKRRRPRSLCKQCRAVKVRRCDVACAVCRRKNRKAYWQGRRVQIVRCPQCGKQRPRVASEIGGRKFCGETCRLLRSRDRVRRRYAELVSMGLCASCGRKRSVTGRTLCSDCQSQAKLDYKRTLKWRDAEGKEHSQRTAVGSEAHSFVEAERTRRELLRLLRPFRSRRAAFVPPPTTRTSCRR